MNHLIVVQGAIADDRQEQEFEPVGSNRMLRVDIGVIAAIKRDLEQAVRARRFRCRPAYRLVAGSFSYCVSCRGGYTTMTGVQILLEEDQDRRLEALAAKRHDSKGQLIRRALDLLLLSESAGEEPLLQLIGHAGRSRRSDVSNRHDQVLADTERARNRRR